MVEWHVISAGPPEETDLMEELRQRLTDLAGHVAGIMVRL